MSTAKLAPFVEHTGDRQLERIQTERDKVAKKVNDATIMSGRAIRAVTLTGGAATSIAHGLGRAITGWWMTDVRDGAGGPFQNDYANQETALANTHVRIKNNGATCVADVWVF